MKAPDKIYLTPRINDKFHLCDLWFNKKKPGECFEYIRKDALLEWLKTKLFPPSRRFRCNAGQRIILRELINEIKSL